MPIMTIDPARVDLIFMECVLKRNESRCKGVTAEGINGQTVFHPDRLALHRTEIGQMLDELPNDFKRWNGTEGASFVEAQEDRHGNQWTDQDCHVDRLFQLGQAVGKVTLLAPRETWNNCLGGKPYFIVND